MNMETLKWIIEVAIGSGLLTLLWKGNRLLNKTYDIFQEYPPHRHVGTLIQYPKGFEPGKTEQIAAGK
jgi:hypothetical protein